MRKVNGCKAAWILNLFCLSNLIHLNAQPKGYLYDESKVRNYTLPDPLICNDGSIVEDKRVWLDKRRPEILRLFQDEVYGHAPGKPKYIEFKEIEKSGEALKGKANRKQTIIQLGAGDKTLLVHLLIYFPKGSKEPIPGFLTLNFHGNHTVYNDPAVKITSSWVRNRNGIKDNQARKEDRGSSSSRWAIERIIERGYAFATAYYGEIDPDFDDGYKNGAHALFGFENPTKRRPNEWGSISSWAWGLSRCMDYLESEPIIDSNRIAVMGHSRLGKTALWAGAVDQRFAMIISNNSGCGGAALSRRKFGETIKRINTSFPHWFCENFKKYNDNEDESPVDQHMLLALSAPRPVYIASAQGDLWADPKGEFLSALAAEPVYKLFGFDFGAIEQPEENQPVYGRIGYHLRSGKHDVTLYDWEQYLNFADQYLK